jgi:hypothetical protein
MFNRRWQTRFAVPRLCSGRLLRRAVVAVAAVDGGRSNVVILSTNFARRISTVAKRQTEPKLYARRYERRGTHV